MIQVIICGPSSTAFSFFSSIPFFRLLPPPRIALLPGTRHRLSSTTTSLPPIPTPFHEVFACSTRSQRTHTCFFAPFSFITSPTWPHHLCWQYFLEWMDEQPRPLARNHRPVLSDKEQQTGDQGALPRCRHSIHRIISCLESMATELLN